MITAGITVILIIRSDLIFCGHDGETELVRIEIGQRCQIAHNLNLLVVGVGVTGGEIDFLETICVVILVVNLPAVLNRRVEQFLTVHNSTWETDCSGYRILEYHLCGNIIFSTIHRVVVIIDVSGDADVTFVVVVLAHVFHSGISAHAPGTGCSGALLDNDCSCVIIAQRGNDFIEGIGGHCIGLTVNARDAYADGSIFVDLGGLQA